ncbi:MAG: hypothetical protein L0271_25080 [Gemmatimonadetes bacterium]|nr:hypothetical protein [Gemmatimonadota bacterium]
MYRHLDEKQILQTLVLLGRRIDERFPGSGLGLVSRELHTVARETHDNIEFLRRPHWPLRLLAGFSILVLVTIMGSALISLAAGLWSQQGTGQTNDLPEVVQAVESLVQEAVFLGIAVWFFLTLESRSKRRRALGAIHELRSIAHIVDMHQLTKDPERLLSGEPDTASSPERNMTRTQLGRYLDYCTELLSLTSKLAALYVQYFNDPVVLDTVSEVESLASGLSNKIWQKITLLDRSVSPLAPADRIV